MPADEGALPRPARAVTLRVVHDENARALRLEGGRADVALNLVSPTLLPAMASQPGLAVASRPGANLTYIVVEEGRPPLDDARVRRGLSAAIDRRDALRDALRRARTARGWPHRARALGPRGLGAPAVRPGRGARRVGAGLPGESRPSRATASHAPDLDRTLSRRRGARHRAGARGRRHRGRRHPSRAGHDDRAVERGGLRSRHPAATGDDGAQRPAPVPPRIVRPAGRRQPRARARRRARHAPRRGRSRFGPGRPPQRSMRASRPSSATRCTLSRSGTKTRSSSRACAHAPSLRAPRAAGSILRACRDAGGARLVHGSPPRADPSRPATHDSW